jgi:hypothetical protein
MSARARLRAWVTSRATDTDDAASASKLIAAYVAEAVREDRKKQDALRDVRTKYDEVVEKFRDLASRGAP